MMCPECYSTNIDYGGSEEVRTDGQGYSYTTEEHCYCKDCECEFCIMEYVEKEVTVEKHGNTYEDS